MILSYIMFLVVISSLFGFYYVVVTQDNDDKVQQTETPISKLSSEQELLARVFFELGKLPSRCEDRAKEILIVIVEKLPNGGEFPPVFIRVLKTLDEIIRDYSALNNEKIINEVSAAKIEKQLENTLIEIKEYLQKKLEANQYDVDNYLAGLRGIKNFINVLKN